MSSPYARPDGRWRYNPPPSWPRPPAGWVPPPGWEPDPAWPAPPRGWAVWLPERVWPARHPGWTAAAAVLVLLFVLAAIVGDPSAEADARGDPLARAVGQLSPTPTPTTTEPTTTSPTTTSATTTATPSPTTSAVPTTPAPTTIPVPRVAVPRPAAQPYYPSCTAVRTAGKAPLRRGQPGYRTALDRDGDGIACEVETAAPAPRTTRPPAPAPAPATKAPPADVYYANCTAAKAAGAAPLYRGEPGYRSALDRDGDGVACES